MKIKFLLFSIVCFFPFSTNQAMESQDTMSQDTVIVLETTQGDVEISLKKSVAPKTCENFMTHINNHYYDGLIFHRVIKGFMIQSGDPTGTGRGGESIWGQAFEDEFSERDSFTHSGILAMANSGPDTNGSQFFITTAETPWLDMKHTIFGEVIKGYDVVKKIESVKVGYSDRPVEDQVIIRAYIKE